jgi:hypothetical protein
MGIMPVRPALLPTAAALSAAIDASAMDYNEIGRRIGMSGGSIRNYRDGRTSVRPAVAAKLGRLLHVDPATLVSGMGRGHPGGTNGKKRGRPPDGTNGAGPAARAAALVSASIPRATPVTLPPAVFRMELRTDGVMLVAVQAALPVKRGAELVRHLLDFGLLPDGDP